MDAVVVPRMNHDFGLRRRARRSSATTRSRASTGAQRSRGRPSRTRCPRLRACAWRAWLPRDELVIVHDRNRTVPEAIERVRRYAPAQAQAMVDAGEVFTARAHVRTLAGKLYRHSSSREPCATASRG